MLLQTQLLSAVTWLSMFMHVVITVSQYLDRLWREKCQKHRIDESLYGSVRSRLTNQWKQVNAQPYSAYMYNEVLSLVLLFISVDVSN